MNAATATRPEGDPAGAEPADSSSITVGEALRRAANEEEGGRPEQAERLYRRILKAAPGHHGAARALALFLNRRGRNEEAIALLAPIVEPTPSAPHHFVLGYVFQGAGRLAEAEAAYRRAIELDPNDAQVHNNLGNVLRDLDRAAEAEAEFRRALALNPRSANAHVNIGNMLRRRGELAEAEASYRHAIAIKPDLAEAFDNLGVALQDQGRLDEAEAAYRAAIAARPDFANAHKNLGLVLLLSGRFAEGWDEYEWRWRSGDLAKQPPNYAQPLWDGTALDGRAILLHCEQGFGDVINFIRYAPMLKARGARVILHSPGPLVRLLRHAPGVDLIVPKGDRLPDFDCYAPLLSLPRLFGTTIETIPAREAYLSAESKLVAAWQDRIGKTPSLKVGLAWAGSPKHANNHNRSLSPAALAPLLAVDGVEFYSLQVGASGGLPGPGIVDLAPQLVDFAETAAALTQLDLLIAVDTAIVHLAGALGRPSWVLLPFSPDWRWLRDREDSPWYASLTLLRQPRAGDWSAVIERARSDLVALAARRGRPAGRRELSLADALRLAKGFERDGKLDQAEHAYRRILAAAPDHGESMRALGLLLHRRERAQEAIPLLKRCVVIQPRRPLSHFTLAYVLQENDRLDEAEAVYRRTIELQPDNAEAHNNRGNALRDLGRFDEAEPAYRRALALKPDYANAHQNLGMLLLLRGRFEEGWPEYEWRWESPGYAFAKRTLPRPLWDGADLRGKRILLHCEQGYGDAIQFARYAPLVAARGASVILECPRPLARLFGSIQPLERLVARGDPLPAFDCHGPLLNLPRLLGTTLDSIPAGAPYLNAPAALLATWRERIAAEDRLRVGLVWAGNPKHRNDRHRSIGTAALAPLFSLTGVSFFGLQLDAKATAPGTAAFVDLAEHLTDFADTAAALSQLDLLISVDTSVAHLAGALGRPSWVLLPFVPDWRWLIEREDSPWYPTMRLFRQHRAGDWASVIERVAAELNAVIAGERTRLLPAGSKDAR